MKKDELHIPFELLEAIRQGECVPVVGAGFSLNALLPDGDRMPLWSDLCKEVAIRLNEESRGDPIKDLSNYCDKNQKWGLINLLRDCLHVRTAKPGPAHLEFAALPFKQVITTNFDFLLERAYEATGKSYLPVVDEDMLAFSPAIGETKLIKMHGDLHHPSLLVVTEDDYDSFSINRERMFLTITNLLINNTILFLGYSIDDPDFRQIWALVKKYFGKFRRPAYALVVDATKSKIDEYARRGVTQIISLPENKMGYGAALASEFRAINHELSPNPKKTADKFPRKVNHE
jgi:hypothetical protein